MLNQQEKLIRDNEILKAPRAGTVMGAPKKEDMNRTWDKSDGQPFCTIGDTRKLRLLVGIGAADYREIRQNLDRVKAENPDDAYLEVTRSSPRTTRSTPAESHGCRIPTTRTFPSH